MLFLIFLLVAATVLRADYPPALVIDSSAYTSAAVTGTNIDAQQYVTSGGVLVLYGSNGGNVSWGADLNSALNSPSDTGSWDGGMNVTLSGSTHTIAVPQVLVYYSGTTGAPSAATMQGYDNNSYDPICNNAIGTSGTSVQAYNGLPDGYIFNFGDNLPCYRYQAGPDPIIINVQNGSWPPSDVCTFPQSLYVDGQLMASSGFDEGINNGYYSDAYYSGTNGSADLHVYISSDSPTGSISGNVGVLSFSDDWNPANDVFTAQAGLGISTSAPGSSPQVWPAAAQITWDGDLLPYAYVDLEGNDVYFDPSTGSQVIITPSDSVTAVQPYQTLTGSYDPNYQSDGNTAISIDGIAGVSADGTSMLGIPSYCVIVITSGWDPVSIGAECDPSPWGPDWYDDAPWDYALYRPHGTAVFAFDEGSGCNPYYSLNGDTYYNPGANNVLDFTSSTPPTYVPSSPWPPSVLYINGIQVSLNDDQANVGPGSASFAYYSSDYSSGCEIYYNYNGTSWGLGQLSGWGFSGNVYGTIDPNTSAYVGSGSVRLGPSPQQGPPEITWNGLSLTFDNTDGNGTDYYSSSVNSTQVMINADDSVDVSGSYTASGTYNPNTYQFNFGGDPNMQIFAAQDWYGELVGTPNGLEMYFNAPGNAQSIQLGNGAYLSSTTSVVYTFQRSDGSYGVKYLGVPLNSIFLVQDNNGNYSSPPYIYEPGIYEPSDSDFSLDTTANGHWPASNLYPTVLYVNGSYTTINMSTVSTSGSGQTQGGGVVYDVHPLVGQQYAGLVSINWTWSTGGFSAGVTGYYASFTSYSGTWNGVLFGGLSSGLVISTDQPPVSPSMGPPQISWNGVDLTFNSVASSVSGSNPTGEDVYEDTAGLGLTATVQSDGTVTLIDASGVQYAGTYTPSTSSPGTGTFSFSGQSPGIVTAEGGSGGNVPTPTPGGSTQVAGDLDIEGNFLTMGTWMTSGSNSVNALGISYTDTQSGNPSLVRFAGTRASLDWIWSESTADNTNPQIPMMELDPSHRLILHDTTSQSAPGVTLDPTGPSMFKNPVLIAPQGDIGMGAFTTGTSP